MSWYFFGGFSAYAIVPSGLVVNHSGCEVTHGWSGAACRARSRATSMPSSRVRSTKARKSSCVPSSGWTDVVGVRDQGVVPALAVHLPDRVDRWQVDHVEAHVGDGRQPLGGLGE